MTLPLTPIPEPQSADYPGHTPGPWYKTKDGKSVCSKHSIYGPVSVTVADCFVSKILDFSEMNANTTLIAASPELLACLTEAVCYLDSGDYRENETQRDLFVRCVAAIAKAKGES